MEATSGGKSTGLLDKILPPRLEDAGLEDCALPPDSLHEAFLKAASAVNSRGGTHFHSDDEDEVEPRYVDGPFPDSVEGCVKEKGGVREVVEDKDTVVVGGDIGEAMDGKGCLDDELMGLKIGEKEE